VLAWPMALASRICHLNRHRPRETIGWLCVTNNGTRLCDSLRAKEEVLWVAARCAKLSESRSRPCWCKSALQRGMPRERW